MTNLRLQSMAHKISLDKYQNGHWDTCRIQVDAGHRQCYFDQLAVRVRKGAHLLVECAGALVFGLPLIAIKKMQYGRREIDEKRK